MLNILHIKMTDLTDFQLSFLFAYCRPPASDVFMDLQTYAHDRFLIVNGADIEYTKKSL